MATLGFLRRDFEVFAIADLDTRRAKIDELIRPRLTRLAGEMASQLSQRLQMEFFPLMPRQTMNLESGIIFAQSRARYQRSGHFALCVSRVGIHARTIVKSTADKRPEIGRAIKAKSVELESSFRGTKIQNYDGWDCWTMPRSVAADRAFFHELADTLADRASSIDVGFGWPGDEALQVDHAEVLDAFVELGPLYRTFIL
jgi:uncharacterized protein YktB (UPF0637 family)